MSVNFINNLTFSVLHELYDSSHPIENVVFSGIGLYIILGAINFGLKENSYHQLSDFLKEDLSELYDPTLESSSITAKYWNYIRLLAQSFIQHQSTLFIPYDLFQYYIHVSALVFDLIPYQINLYNPKLAAFQINELISNFVYESVGDLVDEWAFSEDKLIVIYTFYFHKDWKTSFNPELTKQDFFYLDKNRPIVVHMMNQKGYHHILDCYYYNFRMIFKPYTQEEMYAIIILPNDGFSIQDVLYNFKVDQIANYFKKSHFEYVKSPLRMHLVISDSFHEISLISSYRTYYRRN
ncbi:Serine proteinase inhibitor A3K [Thelohanellus kitauei]|uniref:Serine proteinase inhibitor A3K n=1 Tax=Thelohanellus kitauei TaxID=669202 RepID=A0A0C2MLR2_THEKT|nr:Serine proteinase inhibitor A3K [Thelohanellus kitauei]